MPTINCITTPNSLQEKYGSGASAHFSGQRRELVIIDPNVDQWQILAAGVRPDCELVVLHPQEDGIDQITEILQKTPTPLTVLHLISHGTPGTLYLGNSQLSLDSLNRYTTQLQQWNVDELLLYGCNLALGDAGAKFVEKLQQLTGATVAASRQEIGNGYWSLDFAAEATVTPVPFISTVLKTWPGRLAPTIANFSNSNYTEQNKTFSPASSVTFSGGNNYGGGSIEFSLGATGTADDSLTLIDDGTPNATSGQLSIVGNTVYLGNGTNASIVGFVDPVKNGQNGANLRIQFTNQFQNGNFDLGTPGSPTIPGWTTLNQQVKFGVALIAGFSTPTDNTIPANATNGDQNTAAVPGTMTTLVDALNNDGGGNSVRLTSTGITTAAGYDIVRGPVIYSNDAVSLSAGDTVSFEWQAQGGGDAYDVYGYLVDVTTGNILTILNETGSSATASTTWATESVTITQAGAYKFIFVAGTFDFTGLKGAGAQLYIDDVVVTQAIPTPPLNDADISFLASRVQYSNNSDTPAASKTLTITAEDNTFATGTASATINITPVDDPPTVANPIADVTALEDAAAVTIDLSTVFTDVDNAPAAITKAVSNNTNSTLVNATVTGNTLTLAFQTDQAGTANITVRGTSNGLTVDSTFAVNVTGVNDRPSITASNPPSVAVNSGAQTVSNWATFNPGGGPDEASQTATYTISNISNAALFSATPAIDANGNLTYTPETNITGTSTFDVIVKDSGDTANGGVNTSTAKTFTITVSISAPTITTVGGATNDTTPDIVGTAIPNSTVTIFQDGVQVGTTTAAADGSWTFTSGNLADNTYNFTATATDAGGDTSAPSTAVSLTVDTLIPAAPAITTTGTTKDNTPDIIGTAEPNSTVNILQNGTNIGTATADANGNWTFTPTTAIADGTYNFTATATDAAGNTSTASAAVNLTIDTTAPTALTITTPSGTTNDNTPAITGTAEAGSTVEIFQNGTSIGTATADASGNWSFTPTTALASGNNSLTATATDAAGNTSTASAAVNLTIDTTAPTAPTITTPSGTTNDNTPAITGTAEAGSTVTILSGTTPLGTATADASGNWSFTPTTALASGNNSLTATATDAAGNTSTASAAVNLTIDTTAPTAPTITTPSGTTSDNTPDIIGTAEPNSTVNILQNGTSIGTATADANGNWSFTPTTALAPGNNSLTATATDAAGNASTASTAVNLVINTTAPTTGGSGNLVVPPTTEPTTEPTTTTTTPDSPTTPEVDDCPPMPAQPTVNFELAATIEGTNNDDILTGDNNANIIKGYTGNDFILGFASSDTIIGGVGEENTSADNDVIFGNSGNDLLQGSQGNDIIFGGQDNDIAFGGKGDDLLWGDLGSDTLIGDDGNDVIYGGPGNPSLFDVDLGDVLYGGAGNDILLGNQGDDSLSGGDGSDLLYGGRDNDLLHGDAGNDFLYGDKGNDTLCAGDGDDTLYGGTGSDTGVGQNGEKDLLHGGAGNDIIFGSEGDDTLNGDIGDDTLYGGQNNDIILGGDGSDILSGDKGDDTLTGGGGSDTFRILTNAGTDIITDFTDGEDKIGLAGGLTFSELSIFATTDGFAAISAGGSTLAILNGVNVSFITSDDFISVG